ncbi:AraC family transcriptional regulator [Brevundimonas sp.]|uniref:AraC family transcriptional regulator n=2 Tax=Brevundimonas sp. TaxID=1871086 RepID=UPI0027EF10FE|nr:AraC family transcriptional regulator [Brevundimonas sp.]MDQ7811861.1 AraC family transcriptional regulator [Brevundimonas sp.]
MSTEVLSDVLSTVRLTGAVFFEVDATSPWVAEAPPSAELAHLVLPGAQHVIEYHIIVEGSCWIGRVEDGQVVDLERVGPGSIVMFPHGDQHVMSSAPDMRTEPAFGIFHPEDRAARPPYVLTPGEGGADGAKLICGFLGCDRAPFNPLIEALPRTLRIRGCLSDESGWLRGLINAILTESKARRPGGEGVLARLSELVFIEVVRLYAESLPTTASGWLPALADPHVGRALRLIHGDPARSWSLNTLAREVGVSRSVLAERFTASLGTPPMTYLQNWRMQIAEGLLLGGATKIAQIAETVGYESEAAFSRAFKRCTGVSPAGRRSATRRPAGAVAGPS